MDGQHLSDALPTAALLQRVMRPFDLTRTWGAYNVWALTSAGGPASRAEALAIAVARGLVAHGAERQAVLKAAGLLDIDRRQKERKKTGQPKARKEKAWVKR